MALQLLFTPEALEDYLYWQSKDKKILKKINTLLKECQRTPFDGTGKPEQLRGNLHGSWSRRIDHEHRLVYTVTDCDIRIIACRYHY